MMTANLNRLMHAILLTLVTLVLVFPPTASAGMPLDIDKELSLLRDGKAQVHIGGARYRFAVFTFDDPDHTGLGNAVAGILAHDLLMNSRVQSIGVLRYIGGLGTASDDRQLRYFDKVEPLIESQGVQVAIWGMIRRSGDKVRIDSFTQLSQSAVQKTFSYSFKLPGGSGEQRLVHRIGPSRMLAQRLTLSADEARSLALVADNTEQLRANPGDGAAVVGRLPLGSVFYLDRRQGNWVHVVTRSGGGWLRAGRFCTGSCAPLLAVSQFASSLMAYDDRGYLPDYDRNLAPDAHAVIDQLWAVEILNHEPPGIAEHEALFRLNPWCPPSSENRLQVVAPGGAATCNLSALVRLIGQAQVMAKQGSGEISFSPELLRSVANDLARASQSDPLHVPTLRNLSTLFNMLGDGTREKLASRLAAEAKAAEGSLPGQIVPVPPVAPPEVNPGQSDPGQFQQQQMMQQAD